MSSARFENDEIRGQGWASLTVEFSLEEAQTLPLDVDWRDYGLAIKTLATEEYLQQIGAPVQWDRAEYFHQVEFKEIGPDFLALSVSPAITALLVDPLFYFKVKGRELLFANLRISAANISLTLPPKFGAPPPSPPPVHTALFPPSPRGPAFGDGATRLGAPLASLGAPEKRQPGGDAPRLAEPRLAEPNPSPERSVSPAPLGESLSREDLSAPPLSSPGADRGSPAAPSRVQEDAAPARATPPRPDMGMGTRRSAPRSPEPPAGPSADPPDPLETVADAAREDAATEGAPSASAGKTVALDFLSQRDPSWGRPAPPEPPTPLQPPGPAREPRVSGVAMGLWVAATLGVAVALMALGVSLFFEPWPGPFVW
ncbi:MAG: hypothetical protein LBO66_14890 [Deltaproteobacteria bacterium]|nr:hypothetical protein [Deltaproteobacteria bacterium]